MARNLNNVTKRLGTRYKNWKASEKKKNQDKEDFFKLANDEVSKNTLAQQTTTIQEATEEKAIEFAKKYYPEWEVIDCKKVEAGFTISLRERPEYKPFSYVNKELGLVFQRTASKGEPVLDDEELQRCCPNLWEDITELERIPKEWEELTPEQISAIQPFLLRKPPTMKLAAPKKATEEDLNE